MDAPTDPRSKPPCHRADALAVLKHLRDSGHTAYFAGGCVRDTLLKLQPKDWDIATDAPPNRVREIFPATQSVGAAFGVILVRHGQSVVEVATFRSDGVYEDGRRPSAVRFATPEEDANRRDFTVNGLFLDPIEDRVIDFVGGRDDLAARRIRAIGIPAERFGEDHLRLLRAVRFAARFGFEIEPATAAAVQSLAPRLKGISPERAGEEIRLMFAPPTRAAAWRLLWDLQLAREIFRFLPAAADSLDQSRSIFLSFTPTEAIPLGSALAAAILDTRVQGQNAPDILSFLTKPEISRSVRAMRQALRISNDESGWMAQTLGNIEPLLRGETGVAPMKRFLARPTAQSSRHLMAAMAKTGFHRETIVGLEPRLAQLALQDVSPHPLINGDDLVAAGVRPGPMFKKILDAVYDAQLEGAISDKPSALRMALQRAG
jgi:tRNA nucleotidyltransferase/poly(A) polymerase